MGDGENRPLAIDLFAGLGGWSAGLIAAGFRVVGYDIEDMFAVVGEEKPEHFELVLRDVLTIHGSEFAEADLIVCSPPCQEFSYMAMPWTRAKQIARGLRGSDDFPEGYKGSRTLAELTALFDACFRIQREASEAAGRHIPMVIENVKGAQPWVGRAKWSFGSYFIWGDVPALMPNQKYHQRLKVKEGEQWNVNLENFTGTRGWDEGQKANPDGTAHGTGSWFAVADSKNRGASDGHKNDGGSWFNIGSPGQKVTGQNPVHAIEADGRKNPGFRFDGSGRSFQTASVEGVKNKDADGYERDHPEAFGWKAPRTSSQGRARKAASAKIAKIPYALSLHIGEVYLPGGRYTPARETVTHPVLQPSPPEGIIPQGDPRNATRPN